MCYMKICYLDITRLGSVTGPKRNREKTSCHHICQNLIHYKMEGSGRADSESTKAKGVVYRFLKS